MQRNLELGGFTLGTHIGTESFCPEEVGEESRTSTQEAVHGSINLVNCKTFTRFIQTQAINLEK